MKKLFAIAVLGLSLAGCAAELQKFQSALTVATTATVPASTAQVAVSSFEVLESASTEYLKYCKGSPASTICAPGTVLNPGPLRVVIKYLHQGRSARDQVKAAGKSGALISSTIYTILTEATSNLTASPASTFGAAK